MILLFQTPNRVFFFSVLLKSRKNVTFEGSLFNYEGIYIYEGIHTFAYNICMDTSLIIISV